MCVHWRNVCFPSDIFWFCHLNGKLSLQRVSVRWGERCQPWFTFYDAITQVQIGCNTYASVMRSLKTFAAFKHCTWIYVLLLYAAQCSKMLQKCLILLLCAQCFKITQISHLNFWILGFSTNFWPIKTDLSGNSVWPQALGFQKLAKMDLFWHFLMNFCTLKM